MKEQSRLRRTRSSTFESADKTEIVWKSLIDVGLSVLSMEQTLEIFHSSRKIT